MRTLGLILLMVGTLSGIISLGYSAMPFRIPLTSADAMHAAIVLLIAGALAQFASRV